MIGRLLVAGEPVDFQTSDDRASFSSSLLSKDGRHHLGSEYFPAGRRLQVPFFDFQFIEGSGLNYLKCATTNVF
jgi:hypothetical protein